MRCAFLVLAAITLAAIGWQSRPAEAADCTASIEDIAFGPVDTLGGASLDASASVRISCRSVLGASVCAGIGAGSGGLAADGSRQLRTAGGQILRYQLYQDAGRLVPWGSLENPTLGTTPLVVFPGGNQSAAITLYARIFAGQSTAAPGTDYTSIFGSADTSFRYGELTLLSCGVVVLGSVARPSFRVTASVSPNCMVEADTLDFGRRGVLAGAVASASALRIRCTPGTGYAVALGGTSLEPGTGRRFMREPGGAAVEYRLYQDPGHSVPWTTASTAPGTGNGGTLSLPVYGLVPPQPTPRAGRYTDTVIVTVTY